MSLSRSCQARWRPTPDDSENSVSGGTMSFLNSRVTSTIDLVRTDVQWDLVASIGQPVTEGRSGALARRYTIFAFESARYRSRYLTFCREAAMRRAILVSVLLVFGCGETTKEVGSKAKDMGSKAKDVAKEVGTKVKEIGGKVKEEAKEIGGKVKEEAKEIGGKAKEAGAKVGEKVKEVGKDVKEKAKDAADKIKGDK